ncbi:MAG: acetylxylan esterase, partial [Armatimonadota bacterium]|nr:acetylxylan esterase [Armatimonadota bacterium]
VRALFFEGLPWQGRPTRVFAWLGLPTAPAEGKVPGMVLVHGGGGTAFEGWVRLWNRRGYAAIAMDTCGCTPGGEHGKRPRHPLGGPPGWGGFNQVEWPREDQWTFHAVANIILAHSLLRSLPQVDGGRVGITGISWGGWLTCIVAGLDHRFRFAAPVYGCGFTRHTVFASALEALDEERAQRWLGRWEPALYLKDAALPMLWVSGSNDFAYPLPALQQSYRLAPGPRTLSIRLRMPHGQGSGESPEEIHAFANSLCRAGDPLARVTGQGRDGSSVWATFQSVVPVVRAELNVTKDTGRWQDRQWEALPATVEGNRVAAVLPGDATVYYLNLVDQRNLVVSTEHVEADRSNQ